MGLEGYFLCGGFYKINATHKAFVERFGLCDFEHGAVGVTYRCQGRSGVVRRIIDMFKKSEGDIASAAGDIDEVHTGSGINPIDQSLFP